MNPGVGFWHTSSRTNVGSLPFLAVFFSWVSYFPLASSWPSTETAGTSLLSSTAPVSLGWLPLLWFSVMSDSKLQSLSSCSCFLWVPYAWFCSMGLASSTSPLNVLSLLWGFVQKFGLTLLYLSFPYISSILVQRKGPSAGTQQTRSVRFCSSVLGLTLSESLPVGTPAFRLHSKNISTMSGGCIERVQVSTIAVPGRVSHIVC